MEEVYKRQKHLFIWWEPIVFSGMKSAFFYGERPFQRPIGSPYVKYLFSIYEQDLWTGEWMSKYKYERRFHTIKPISKYMRNTVQKAILNFLGFS